ncbi:protein CASC3-like isoform X2 [Oppia nitens]|uniref:protein CASC3-like isoform X2 n=1 Tax=Oppia nitens TaxID=1686743 RepID=UPI0023DB4AEE|nr:protein CASC3-like isoform X2 [Oppia nitens]
MCDNSDKEVINDKQSDDQPLNDTDVQVVKSEAIVAEANADDINQSKDMDDDSQEIKSSDLESEVDRRCTSASNAGESEYESADDEEVKRADSFEDTTSDLPTESSDKSKESTEEVFKDAIVESDNKSKQCDPVVESDAKNDSQDKDETELSTDMQIESNDSETVEKVNDSPKVDNVESINCESTKEIVNNEQSVINSDKDVEDKEPSKEINDLPKEIIVNEEDVDDNDDSDREELGDNDDEYEDIDDSDEVSVETDNEDKMSKENEDEDNERQQGDGEESVSSQSAQKDKNLDHDEDKRNPQYIPKRGPFYEHDDRMSEIVTSEEAAEAVKEGLINEPNETPEDPVVIVNNPVVKEAPIIAKKVSGKKKLWNEGDRWGHDLFREDEQTPKSKDELVNVYGYDIRNEEDAPKARRKHRYTRGPTKYTRQWQDENAYGKPTTKPLTNTGSVRSERTDRDRDREHLMRSNERVHRDKDRSRDDFKERHDRIDKTRIEDRQERSERKDRRQEGRRDKNYRIEKINENQSRGMSRNDRPMNDKRSDENIDKRGQTFTTEDFPELPNNDLRKKLNSNHQQNVQQEAWKSGSRFGGQKNLENTQSITEYKTEPMKIAEAIEHNNRTTNYGDSVVRTQTFENSKLSQRRSSGIQEYEEERVGGNGRNRNQRKSAEMSENSGRPIRKSNSNLNYSQYSHTKEPTDNYRNRNSGRNYHLEDSNRSTDRYYEEENYVNQRDRESNYITETSAHQKLSIEDKSAVINRNAESEQTRPKRYSSLRQQTQRVGNIAENVTNITPNTQMSQTPDNRNINAHQFYESHPIQTTAYYTEQSVPQRNTYHPYMSPNANDSPQSHPPTYITQPLPQQIQQTITQPMQQPMPQQLPQTMQQPMPQQLPQPMPQPMPQQLPQTMQQPMPQPIPQPITQRYISQASPQGTGDNRFMPTTVPPNVVAASVSTQMPQPIPQTGPPPPPTGYIPSFPSGYPQFPPAPPPSHVPPGYPGHVPPPPQQASPHQMSELYRGGVTYYDTQSQQQNAIRQIPQRRPKAAIPIVPPPDSHSSDGDGDKSYVSVNS